MSRATQGSRIVAELGRPETAQETAARKAENSRNHRNRQTANNLVLSLLATVGLVVFIVLIVPRGNESLEPQVDFAAAASQVQSSVTEPLAVPDLAKDWSSNLAQMRTGADGIQTWNIGLITPGKQYIGFSQGLAATDSWLTTKLTGIPATGQETIDGVTWTVYDNRDASHAKGNMQYALSTTTGTSTYVLYGTAADADFHTVATAVAEQIESGDSQ